VPFPSWRLYAAVPLWHAGALAQVLCAKTSADQEKKAAGSLVETRGFLLLFRIKNATSFLEFQTRNRNMTRCVYSWKMGGMRRSSRGHTHAGCHFAAMVFGLPSSSRSTCRSYWRTPSVS
jgi:hypothetical protein